MSKVFISYRRKCSSETARLMREQLAKALERESVFMDIYDIGLGDDWPSKLAQTLDRCEALIALIGPDWLDATNSEGGRALDDRSDPVRREIEGALERGILLVPVFDRTPVIEARELPVSLRPLLRKQAAILSDERYETDLERLVARIERALTVPHRRPSWRKRMVIALAVALVALVALRAVRDDLPDLDTARVQLWEESESARREAFLNLVKIVDRRPESQWIVGRELSAYIRKRSPLKGTPLYADPPLDIADPADGRRYDPRITNRDATGRILDTLVERSLEWLGTRDPTVELETAPPGGDLQKPFERMNGDRDVRRDTTARDWVLERIQERWIDPGRTLHVRQLVEEFPNPPGTEIPGVLRRPHLDLSRSDLSAADCSGYGLEGANFSGTNLSFANLVGASLVKADLSSVWLVGSNLFDADLREADMKDATVRCANLGHADLRGAWLVGVDFWRANFWEADLSHAYLIGSSLVELQTFSGAKAVNVVAHGCDFSGARLYTEEDGAPADLAGARLLHCDFGGADLRRLDLGEVDVSGSTFEGADLRGTDLRRARGADSPDAFRGARFDSSTRWPQDWSDEDIESVKSQ